MLQAQTAAVKTTLLAALLSAFFPIAALAGGSFFFTDLKDLLAQQPALARFITEHFDVAETGSAPRIGSGVNKELAGIRIAPFEIDAKPKGASGNFTFILIIDAETTYLDRSGRTVSLPNATDIRQRFTGFRVLPKPPEPK